MSTSMQNTGPAPADELTFDKDSGISPEDQKDILHSIEEVALQNKITARPEDFVAHAAKRGILFPIIVIAACVVGLLGGGAAFYFLFQQGQTSIVKGTVGTITAEGQLIQAVRQEANNTILAKDQEITTINGRLADIDKQRQDLQSNMDAKVSAKEADLRAQMAAALDAEKARLEKQGLTQAVIAQRLQDAEKQRAADLAKQLDAYKRSQEAQRALDEQNLKTLENNFQANLQKANAEKQQALEEAQKRETALRGQFTQKTQTLESTAAQAQAQLAAIAAQRQKEDLVVGQLNGLYAVVQDQISHQSYDKAIASLGSLKDFINRPDVSALPALAKRRDFDLFVIDSLSTYVQGEIDKAKVDTATLLQAASQFTALRQQVSQAQELLKAGKTADAEKAYSAALNLIPEVATSYAYFVGRDKEAEAAREVRLTEALDRAESAFNAGNYSGAAAAYREAFSFMPVASDRLDRAVSNLQSAGTALATARQVAAQTRSAAGGIRQADTLRGQGKYEDALAGYLNVLATYPLATQSKDALAGVQAAVRGLNDTVGSQSQAAQANLNSQIASVQKTSSEQVAALQKDLEARRADVASLTRQVKDMQDRLDALDQSYKSYVGQEDPVLKSRGEDGLMDTKPYFDAFFRSAPLQKAFPGLAERVKRYDAGFQSAGRSDALQDATNIVINYSRQRTPELKRQFIQSELKTYAKDPDMIQLLQELDQRLGK
ncbi:MAG TPA: hypothetical protein VMQ10_14480 [Spirochaetia bacterium]|nr:hypothetical protein [Spirochaetia bacterium]